jgi:hypothetical protein
MALRLCWCEPFTIFLYQMVPVGKDIGTEKRQAGKLLQQVNTIKSFEKQLIFFWPGQRKILD